MTSTAFLRASALVLACASTVVVPTACSSSSSNDSNDAGDSGAIVDANDAASIVADTASNDSAADVSDTGIFDASSTETIEPTDTFVEPPFTGDDSGSSGDPPEIGIIPTHP